MYSATLFSTISSIALLIGRAPNSGSNPASATLSINAWVISSVIFLSAKILSANSTSRSSDIFLASFIPNGRNKIIPLNLFRNSGANILFLIRSSMSDFLSILGFSIMLALPAFDVVIIIDSLNELT